MSKRRAVIADVLGLALVLGVLLDYLRPGLLLLPTIAAGGDTPCHYPTLAYFSQTLLPQLRLHGWYAGSYLGHPLLLYYFPLPFLVMSALAPLTGLPVAFKLGTALGVLLLPPAAYLSFRLMGFRFPAPLLASGASLVFLLLEDNPIWGGTLASMLTGEFAYSYGTALALVFLGVVYRAYARGWRPLLPGAVLALTALAHGYAVLWAGLSASYFLWGARRSARSLLWLAGVGGFAFALAGLWLLPLLVDWRWTTPYDDPWITATWRNLAPQLLWPLFGCALVGLGFTLLWDRREQGGADQRLLFLFHAALVAAALAAAGPALGIIDVRFVPFAQLALCLAGAAALGLALQRLAAPDLAALGLLAAFVVYADGQSKVLRAWIDWNYSGLEAKELWPAFSELARRLQGGVGDPRVAVEYSREHEKAGSIRMYEALPHFTGRPTLEGVYNQASLMTHPVYYLASELGETSPNPFRSREYSSFDTENALRHLRLLHVSDVVALSPKLVSALEQQRDKVALLARVPPYTVFRLKEVAGGYVEPLRAAPVRAPLAGWRDRAYRWFAWKPLSPAHLVFSDDEAFFGPAHTDPWLPPPVRPLPADEVQVSERVGQESLVVHTSRPGHPLLVKISYHPRWRAEGADGPFLVSPALMMIVPRQAEVRLVYARTTADHLGLALTLVAAGSAAFLVLRRRAPAVAGVALPADTDACALPAAPRRWSFVVPAALLVLLVAGRLAGTPRDNTAEVQDLYERASQAFGGERWAEAAELSRHALARPGSGPMTAELRCLRGESLLNDGRPREALEPFGAVADTSQQGPYVPQALFGLARARAALGDRPGAAAALERLLSGHAETPWAERANRDPSLLAPARSPAPPGE